MSESRRRRPAVSAATDTTMTVLRPTWTRVSTRDDKCRLAPMVLPQHTGHPLQPPMPGQ